MSLKASAVKPFCQRQDTCQVTSGLQLRCMLQHFDMAVQAVNEQANKKPKTAQIFCADPS